MLYPLEAWKKSPTSPLMLIAVFPDLTNCIIQEHHRSSHPRRCITNLKKGPVQTVISLLEIQFEEDPLKPLRRHLVDNLVKGNNPVMDPPALQERGLKGVGNPFRHRG